LLEYFGDAPSAWQASESQLLATGLAPRLVASILQTRASGQLDRAWAVIQEKHIQVLTWEDPGYPQRLLEIEQPPPVLYVCGEIHANDAWAVALVGTRRVTAYGRQVTEELASGLAAQGVTVVSGLARGIDAIAHQAVLRAGGRTLAVLGSGVDQIYPPEHTRLAADMLSHGAVISDYPPGTAPEAGNFPPRNRIISGLSLAVVVIEASEKSGALITASFAVEQGRAVFAVPGSIYAPQSKGANRLIQEGAQVVLGAKDILETLNLTQVGQHQAARSLLPENATEAQLYHILGSEPLHVDDIRQRAGLPIEQISATLTMMELKGMVRQVGGMNYIAVKEEAAEYHSDS
jgi:DNA processing protein